MPAPMTGLYPPYSCRRGALIWTTGAPEIENGPTSLFGGGEIRRRERNGGRFPTGGHRLGRGAEGCGRNNQYQQWGQDAFRNRGGDGPCQRAENAGPTGPHGSKSPIASLSTVTSEHGSKPLPLTRTLTNTGNTLASSGCTEAVEQKTARYPAVYLLKTVTRYVFFTESQCDFYHTQKSPVVVELSERHAAQPDAGPCS